MHNDLIRMQANQKHTSQSIKPRAAREIFALILVYFRLKAGFTEKGASSRIFSGRMKKDAAVVQQVTACVNELTGKPPAAR
ncbi:MAG: hypothetical protein ACN6PP_00560 [Delftia tsuruhatensis]